LDSAPDGGPLLRPLVPDEAHGHAFELPGINPEYMGRQHRYVYAAWYVSLISAIYTLFTAQNHRKYTLFDHIMHARRIKPIVAHLAIIISSILYSAKRPTNCWNALAKADIESGEVKVWHEPGAACWEPIFVARPRESGDEEVDEDDGVVLSTIMQADGRSALLVLDATSWKEIARAVLPYGLPNGFHGAWVGAKHVRST
jgi:carotenoid cleavage dioxygenase-like enzyme